MGRAKIFFKDPDYHLHGTNAVNSLEVQLSRPVQLRVEP